MSEWHPPVYCHYLGLVGNHLCRGDVSMPTRCLKQVECQRHTRSKNIQCCVICQLRPTEIEVQFGGPVWYPHGQSSCASDLWLFRFLVCLSGQFLTLFSQNKVFIGCTLGWKFFLTSNRGCSVSLYAVSGPHHFAQAGLCEGKFGNAVSRLGAVLCPISHQCGGCFAKTGTAAGH